MKKYASILFLILLLANGLGFYVFYSLRLYQIRIEMRASLKFLPDDQLELIELSEPEYRQAIVEDGEIKVNGKMFDVARVATSGGQVKVYCLHDAKEDNLFLMLDEILTQPKFQGSDIPHSIYAFIFLVFLNVVAIVTLCNRVSSIEWFHMYRFSLKLNSREITIPPPRAGFFL